MAKFLVTVLQGWGFHPELYDGVDDAAGELARVGGARLALLDAGPELFRQVRESEGLDRPYLIGFSTDPRGANAAEVLAAGADDFVGDAAGLQELRGRVEAGRRVLAWQSRLLDRWKAAVTGTAEEPPLVTVCAACKKARSPAGTWEPFSELLPRLAKRCTHGYCPECYDAMTREVDAHLAGRKEKRPARRPEPAWN